MNDILISGSGIYTFDESISNGELVTSFNRYVEQYNKIHAVKIASGDMLALEESSEDFIVRVSGIKSRYVVNKSGILDPSIMRPQIKEYSEEGRSLQADMGEKAARLALQQASKSPDQVDAVMVACTAVQTLYPAIAIEIQQALGTNGFAFDMQAACSSMLFGIQIAVDSIYHGNASCVLVISPEICTARVCFQDRETHFLFGDAAAAILIEKNSGCQSKCAYEIIGTKLHTQFSDTVHNHFGFLNQAASRETKQPDNYFTQQGKKLFKDIVPLASQFILEYLSTLEIPVSDLKRLWLHQANLHINRSVSQRVFGRNLRCKESPVILDEYANTSSAGAIIAFHKYNDDLNKGDIGVICAFGAGYSLGCAVLRKFI
jgi:beta-ketodecanoyl-[acyl-carrier-protein] synthase